LQAGMESNHLTDNPHPYKSGAIHNDYEQQIWIEDSDEPILLMQYLNTSRIGEVLNIYPRGMCTNMQLLSQIQKEFKRGEHPKSGVLECIFEDQDGVKWMQILTTIKGEPEKVLLNLKFWQFD
jgi:hypothetical protein